MIEIGKITTTHGIRGGVKIINLSDFDRFKKGEKVFIVKNNEKIYLTIKNVQHQVKNLIVTFNEFNNINEVIDFRGLTVYSETRGELKENEVYLETLYDLDVYNVLTNELIGFVDDILELPHGLVLVVINEETDKRFLIPFEEAFVKNVLDDRILIEPIEGLL